MSWHTERGGEEHRFREISHHGGLWSMVERGLVGRLLLLGIVNVVNIFDL